MNMTAIWQAWGKLERKDIGVRVHPLLDHMTDVACVLGELLRTPGLRRAAEQAAGRPLSEADIQRLCVLAFLHDIGKAGAGFQVRYWLYDERPPHWAITPSGHGPQGWALFMSSNDGWVLAGLPLQQMDDWGDVETTVALLHASISHHGRPVSPESGAWNPIQNGAELVYDPAATVAQMGQAIQAQYPLAFASGLPPLPDAPGFAHCFAGLVQLADWLGSDTRAGFFPFSEPGEVRAATAPARAQHAVRAIGLAVAQPEARQRATCNDFSAVFQLPAARPMQLAAAQAPGHIVVLEAETGSGKTEAALWRFLQLWRAGQVDGLYFALPTRVAATQLSQRIERFVAQAWPSDAPLVVRALPGYATADGHGYQALPGFQVLWHDDAQDADAERRWAAESPKRFLAAPIAVGTVDQALLGALQTKHAHMRHALLARSLLVVDEVHASDAYMTHLTEHLLQAHVALGGHALLLSATLGAVARARYLSIENGSMPRIPPLSRAEVAPYPAMSSAALGELQAIEGNPRHKQVHWQTLDAIDAPERIAELAVNAAAQGARVLVVRNTVPAAIATLQAVEALTEARGLNALLFHVQGMSGSQPVSTLHHSRFAKQDRPLLDAAVQAQLGKDRAEPGGRIVIGTQTLEQSLDIDADLLITDLCPMDVLLQRLGRLHRHERPSAAAPHDRRPAGFEQARAWVLTPPGHDLKPLLARQRHGLGPIYIKNQPMAGVYPDLRMLEATRRLIDAQATRSIPADNRLLVEHSTHPEALDAIAQAMGPDWVQFGQQCDGTLAANITVAKLHALPFSKPFGQQLFPQDEVIGTRLGAADRLLTFAEPAPPGPFGGPVAQLALRHHLLPRDGLATDSAIPAQAADDGSFGFALGETRYRYGRFGVERL
jgi:CRISPR-associated endonuclease/helicase Cas3